MLNRQSTADGMNIYKELRHNYITGHAMPYTVDILPIKKEDLNLNNFGIPADLLDPFPEASLIPTCILICNYIVAQQLQESPLRIET